MGQVLLTILLVMTLAKSKRKGEKLVTIFAMMYNRRGLMSTERVWNFTLEAPEVWIIKVECNPIAHAVRFSFSVVITKFSL